MKLKKYVFYVALGVVFLFWAKANLIGQVWATPNEPKMYSIWNKNQELIILLMPKNKIYSAYNNKAGYSETALTQIKSSDVGTHYFFGLWVNPESPGSILFNNTFSRIRYYPDGTTPIMLVTEMKDKFVKEKSDKEYFAQKGEQATVLMLYSEDSITLGDNTLQRVELRNGDVEYFENLFSRKNKP